MRRPSRTSCTKSPRALRTLAEKPPGLGTGDLACLKEAATVLACKLLNLGNRGGPDPAARRIDNAFHAHLVCRIHNHLEVGHHIANLGTIKKARAAHNAIGHTGTQEHIFQDARLRVGAVKHRHVVVIHTVQAKLLDLGGNPAAFIALVRSLVGLNLFSIARRGKQAFLFALRVYGAPQH